MFSKYFSIFALVSFVSAVPSVKVIPCTFMTREYPLIGNIHECFTSSVEFREPDELVDNVTLTLPNGVTMNDINALWIHDTISHFFPKGVEDFFTNLTVIQVSSSGLKAITQDDLKPFTNLKGLWLNENDLISLEPNLFQFNTELRIIRFDSNRIRSIPRSIFDPLVKLTEVHFTGNVCTSLVAKSKMELNLIVWDIIQRCQSSEDGESCQDEYNEIRNLKAALTKQVLKNAEMKKKIYEIAGL